MFAAANTTLIQLFATYTFENIGNLKGHSGKVRRRGGGVGMTHFFKKSCPTPLSLRSAVCCGVQMTAILFLAGWRGQYTTGTSRTSSGKESVS